MSPASALDQPSQPQRLLSIDALRGFDMFWIVKGSNLAKALAILCGYPVLANQFSHARWEGFSFYDLIFPLFVFLVGVVLPFSLAKYTSGPNGRANYGSAYLRIVRRAVLLFFLGMVYHGFLQLDLTNFRWPGVLHRIAICYFFAALAELHLSIVGKVILLITLLVGYWAVLMSIPAPGFKAYDLTPEGNLATYVDRLLLPGGKNMQRCDNEGILSTIPAIATALFGVLAGHWLRSSRSSGLKVLGLYLAAIVCLAAGYAWSLQFPLIKILWTSSYVLVTAGWSLALLATFYGIIDVLGWQSWSYFFVVIGANAITIYLMQKFVDFTKMSDFFLGGVNRYLGQYLATSYPQEQVARAQTVLSLIGVLAIEWLVLWYLYRNKTFLRV